MKRALATLLAFTALSAGTPAMAADAPTAQMALLGGHSQVLHTATPLVRVAVADPKVLDVRVLGTNQLLVQAIGPGRSSLWVWAKGAEPKSYEVTVGQDTAGIQADLRRLTGNASFTVQDNGHSFLLAGEASTPQQRDAAVKIASAYGMPVVDTTTLATRRDQIAIDVHVLELAKTASLNLGLAFGSGQVSSISNGIRQYVFQPGSVMTGEAVTGQISSWANLDFLATRIDVLQNRGEAKLLARPTLVTSDGGTAKFLAGGEIPVPEPQALGTTTISWKEFGVRLEVQPTLTADGRISLVVKPEVSSLDFANGIKQANYTIPAIRTRRADTQVMLAPGETLLLGGLMDNEHDRSFALVPGLGDIPVLGELFRSRNFQDNRTELAILVTPHLVGPTTAVSPPLEGVRHELENEK